MQENSLPSSKTDAHTDAQRHPTECQPISHPMHAFSKDGIGEYADDHENGPKSILGNNQSEIQNILPVTEMYTK
jgi:hypothetical protein